MAEFRATKSGINADVQRKLNELYDVDLEYEVKDWMEAVSEEAFPEPNQDALEALGDDKDEKWANFYASLRDGAYLCRFLRKLDPETKAVPKKFEKPSKLPFNQREAIGMFLNGCKEYGVEESGLFETECLHGATNLNVVLTTFVALGSVAQSKEDYKGPSFGPRRAAKEKREFSEEKLAGGKAIIGLQMGSNQGASQSGMTPYGMGRQIYSKQ